MLFDNVVLNILCEVIDDPTTYYNFNLLNKKCHKIALLHREQKIKQFLKKVETHFGQHKTVLPNGMMHGIHHETFVVSYHHFGKVVAMKSGTTIGADVVVYECKCIDLSPKEVLKKYGIDIKQRDRMEQSVSSCPYCSSKSKSYIYATRDRMHKFRSYYESMKSLTNFLAM